MRLLQSTCAYLGILKGFVPSGKRSFDGLRSGIYLTDSCVGTQGTARVLLSRRPSEYHSKGKKSVRVPAKVILSKRQAVQMVSVAQPLAQLARDRAEPIFARVNCVLLISKELSVRIVGL
jgi:hypothetical protein